MQLRVDYWGNRKICQVTLECLYMCVRCMLTQMYVIHFHSTKYVNYFPEYGYAISSSSTSAGGIMPSLI